MRESLFSAGFLFFFSVARSCPPRCSLLLLCDHGELFLLSSMTLPFRSSVTFLLPFLACRSRVLPPPTRRAVFPSCIASSVLGYVLCWVCFYPFPSLEELPAAAPSPETVRPADGSPRSDIFSFFSPRKVFPVAAGRCRINLYARCPHNLLIRSAWLCFPSGFFGGAIFLYYLIIWISS